MACDMEDALDYLRDNIYEEDGLSGRLSYWYVNLGGVEMIELRLNGELYETVPDDGGEYMLDFNQQMVPVIRDALGRFGDPDQTWDSAEL